MRGMENRKWKVESEKLSGLSFRGAKRRGNLAEPGWITGYSRRKRDRLREIATSAYGLLAMTNMGASTVLTAACTNRQFIAGRGQPGPYNKCMRSAMACATCECLPEIAPQGHFLALRAQGATGAVRPRNDKFLAHFAK